MQTNYMNEEFLHFIFRNRLWDKDFEFTTTKDKIEILDTGFHNHNSGPDFFNSKIRIGETLWVGNAEIHINSSDWYKHNHDRNLAYGNVILHIVFNHDKAVYLPDGSEIPTWEMKFPHTVYNKYAEIKNNEKDIPCSDYLEFIDDFVLRMWLERMAIERLETKTTYLEQISEKTAGDINETLYVSLARSFGFGINADAFESLALATPLNLLQKYLNDNLKIEALLYGQAGFLNETVDEYSELLKREYLFLAKKHILKPLPVIIWKKSRMRPSNFPTQRIAQFSSILPSFSNLIDSLTNPELIANAEKLLDFKVSNYWQNHFSFGVKSEKLLCQLGKDTRDLIFINTLAPFAFFYFSKYRTEEIHDNIITKLSNLKAEDNREIRIWKNAGISASNAFESQALLHLRKEYCSKQKCANCAIGVNLMKKVSEV
jgi:hypothetical protein